MPTPVAFLLKSPVRTFIFVLSGAIGSRDLLSSMSAPDPRAHQWSGLMPHAINRVANRFGKAAAAPAAAGESPQTGTDSSHGKAIATPAPRKNARRVIPFPLRCVPA